jgi:hypothetical protein
MTGVVIIQITSAEADFQILSHKVETEFYVGNYLNTSFR